MDIATNAETLNRLAEAIDQVRRSFYRLVLLAGPSGTGKTGIPRQLAEPQRCPYLNVNLQLSQRMLELPRAKRPRSAEPSLPPLHRCSSSHLPLARPERMIRPARRPGNSPWRKVVRHA